MIEGMRNTRKESLPVLLLLAVVLTMTGCATTGVASRPAPEPDGTAADVPDEEVAPVVEPPQETNDARKPTRAAPAGFAWGQDGALVHPPSGAHFEAEYGEYARQGETFVYDSDGLDVSASYRDEALPSLATIYVYPSYSGPASGKLLRGEYHRCIQEIEQYRDAAVVESEDTLIVGVADPDTYPYHTARLSIVEDGVSYVSFVVLFGIDEWFLLFRISAPATAVSESDIPRMLEIASLFDVTTITGHQ